MRHATGALLRRCRPRPHCAPPHHRGNATHHNGSQQQLRALLQRILQSSGHSPQEEGRAESAAGGHDSESSVAETRGVTGDTVVSGGAAPPVVSSEPLDVLAADALRSLASLATGKAGAGGEGEGEGGAAEFRGRAGIVDSGVRRKGQVPAVVRRVVRGMERAGVRTTQSHVRHVAQALLLRRHSVCFVKGAVRNSQFPGAATGHERPEIAFIGRSNVGKSSLLNALLGGPTSGKDGLAFTSKRAGKTTEFNFYGIFRGAPPSKEDFLQEHGGATRSDRSKQRASGTSSSYVRLLSGDARGFFVDVPGVGYARRSKRLREVWQGLVQDYVLHRKPLKAVLHLIDARAGPSEQDIMLLQTAIKAVRMRRRAARFARNRARHGRQGTWGSTVRTDNSDDDAEDDNDNDDDGNDDQDADAFQYIIVFTKTDRTHHRVPLNCVRDLENALAYASSRHQFGTISRQAQRALRRRARQNDPHAMQLLDQLERGEDIQDELQQFMSNSGVGDDDPIVRQRRDGANDDGKKVRGRGENDEKPLFTVVPTSAHTRHGLLRLWMELQPHLSKL